MSDLQEKAVEKYIKKLEQQADALAEVLEYVYQTNTTMGIEIQTRKALTQYRKFKEGKDE